MTVDDEALGSEVQGRGDIAVHELLGQGDLGASTLRRRSERMRRTNSTCPRWGNWVDILLKLGAVGTRPSLQEPRSRVTLGDSLRDWSTKGVQPR